IGSSAFSGCSGLTSLTLPAGITSINNGTFSGCNGLTSLTLPAGITSIGERAFWDCSGLTSIYVYSEKVPKMGSDVFYGVDKKNCTLYVPQGTETDYFLADVWGDFENIVEFDATGIDKTTTSTDVEEVSRYSLNGQRLVGPTKGLNIVKYSDGSVKKVAVE
uniref:leucine-rich repeat domain-containing protein n=1 Tax=Prevotella merdae TaxID=2079531 RepID=UPI003F80B00C